MRSILKKFGLPDGLSGAGSGSWMDCSGEIISSKSPIDGQVIGEVRSAADNDYGNIVDRAMEAFKTWRMIPAPQRGDIVRQIGNALRSHKKDLAELITLEMGKLRVEGEGEVQEMIDMADFAVGQSRMLYGSTMPSERAAHRMYEQWHPLGPVGVITSFNFPLAPWSWNAMIALVAGDTVIWKPSSKTPLAAMAAMKIVWDVLKKNGLPEGVCNLIIGKRDVVGEPLIRDRRVMLISATGSVAMGRHVGQVVAARLGRTILELGGNNAVIVTPRADLAMAVHAIVFGAVGTAGQRCTTTRRVIVHEDIYDLVVEYLDYAYQQIPIGNPLIFTNDLIEAESFLSHRGSDCGIANVNVGTSGAEIGGAFGGEKDTGGGREAGSDVWKSYMRRQTCTINWSGNLPLAQGIKFDIHRVKGDNPAA